MIRRNLNSYSLIHKTFFFIIQSILQPTYINLENCFECHSHKQDYKKIAEAIYGRQSSYFIDNQFLNHNLTWIRGGLSICKIKFAINGMNTLQIKIDLTLNISPRAQGCRLEKQNQTSGWTWINCVSCEHMN